MDENDQILIDQWLGMLRTRGAVEMVFDVGANRGQFMKGFRKLAPQADIYSFEPAEEPFRDLQRSAMDDERWMTLNCALGTENTAAQLHRNSDDVTSSMLRNSERIFDFAPESMCTPMGEQLIQVCRLDTFCTDNQIDRIDILKIDSQGFERQILQGCGRFLRPAKIRGLFIEVLFVDLYQGQAWCGSILEMLRTHGYGLFGFVDVAKDPRQGWKWADALFLPEAYR
tara:strand:- start:304 stop:984 length:681 start_codon:yes stop_codon:yes gene_type:complete